MKKINLGSVLLTAGVLMFLVALAITYDKSKAAAYANQYQEKYEVTKWRVLRNAVAEYGTYQCLILGPAEWKVTGSFGDGDAGCSPGETCFEETWSVPNGNNGWHQSDTYLEPGVAETFVSVVRSGDNAGKDDNGVLKCDSFVLDDQFMIYNNRYRTYQAGLYGGYAARLNRSGLATNESVGFHSWPKEWSISGSVGAQ